MVHREPPVYLSSCHDESFFLCSCIDLNQHRYWFPSLAQVALQSLCCRMYGQASYRILADLLPHSTSRSPPGAPGATLSWLKCRLPSHQNLHDQLRLEILCLFLLFSSKCLFSFDLKTSVLIKFESLASFFLGKQFTYSSWGQQFHSHPVYHLQESIYLAIHPGLSISLCQPLYLSDYILHFLHFMLQQQFSRFKALVPDESNRISNLCSLSFHDTDYDNDRNYNHPRWWWLHCWLWSSWCG